MGCGVRKFALTQPTVGTSFVTYGIPACLCDLRCNTYISIVSPLATTSTLPAEVVTTCGAVLPLISTLTGAAITGNQVLANVFYNCTLARVPSGFQLQVTNPSTAVTA